MAPAPGIGKGAVAVSGRHPQSSSHLTAGHICLPSGIRHIVSGVSSLRILIPEFRATLPDRMFSTRRFPELHYFPITKCGCTFVKNLLWRIDHGRDHEDALRIHRYNHLFPKAGQMGRAIEQIRQMPYSFVILRNPVDRFLSLYFDKVIGPGAERFVPLRRVLLEGYGLIPDPADIEEHRANCHVLLGWLDKSLNGDAELPRDTHWAPQVQHFPIIRTLNPKVMLLDDLVAKLQVFLAPLIPEIAQLLRGVERNAAPRPVSPRALMTEELREGINELYARDARAVCRVAQYWEREKPATGRDFPRFNQVV